MAGVTRSFSRSLKDKEFLVEYIEGCGDEEETYEEVWQHVNERELRGWKLRDVREVSTGGVELSWDGPFGSQRG